VLWRSGSSFHFVANPEQDLVPTPSFTHVGESESFFTHIHSSLHCFYLSRRRPRGVKIFNILESLLKFSGTKYSLLLVEMDTYGTVRTGIPWLLMQIRIRQNDTGKDSTRSRSGSTTLLDRIKILTSNMLLCLKILWLLTCYFGVGRGVVLFYFTNSHVFSSL
jgi:hypothetical protein